MGNQTASLASSNVQYLGTIARLDKTSFSFTRADLGFTPEENIIIDKMLRRPHGIILLTGPTGCGKSTTLYSFLKEVNDPKW